MKKLVSGLMIGLLASTYTVTVMAAPQEPKNLPPIHQMDKKAPPKADMKQRNDHREHKNDRHDKKEHKNFSQKDRKQENRLDRTASQQHGKKLEHKPNMPMPQNNEPRR